MLFASSKQLVNPGMIMTNRVTEMKLRVIDVIVCVVISGLYAYAAWASKRHVDASFVIRIALLFWLEVVLIRLVRLLQYVTTFNVDLIRYIDRDLDSIEIPLQSKFREWNPYLKEPLRKARPFYILFFLIYMLHLFIKIPDEVYFVTTGLLLFTFITIVVLSIVTKVDEYIATLYLKYKPDIASRYRKTELIRYIKRGLIVAVVFDLCLVFLFSIPIYHYVLYFLTISMLYSFSAIILHLYKSFSDAVFLVLGHKFDRIPLRMGSPY
jgi:hypothetical protein